jgi:mannose-1-phosphate guanylyltransferase
MNEARVPKAAMVLCAGLGTRLRPLTEEIAKPLVPIGDRPAVAHVVERLSSFVTRVINVHHRPEDLEWWAAERDIAVSHEVDLLGTAGGVEHAAPLLGEGDVLVWNGDILCELDVSALVAAHRSEATLAVVARSLGTGNVGTDDAGRIVRLRKERFGEETRSADFIGIHIVGAALRAMLPSKGCLVGDVYLPALARGARLDAHVVEVPFSDVGSIAEYVAANRAWLERRGAKEWSAPDALVRASIEGSIVGAGARIDAPAKRCIVWPNSQVTEAIEDAIVTPRQTVGYAPAR